MKNLIFVFVFMIGFYCQAQEPQSKRLKIAVPKNQLQFFLINPELRYERSNSQELVDRKPKNFAIAYKVYENSFLAEYSQFDEMTGNATSSLSRHHQDFSILYRNHFLESQSGVLTFSMYWGAGAGLYQDEMTTTLLGLSRVDKSNPRLMGALSFGSDLKYGLSRNMELAMAAEGRSQIASDFDPNPVWSAIVRLGLVVRY